MAMNMRELNEASRVAEKIRRHDELAREIDGREVDFVEHDRRRSVGKMQMNESEIEDLRSAMKAAVVDWFADRRERLCKDLEALGVDVSDQP